MTEPRHEEALRRLLHETAEEVAPRGDGLALIRSRLEARRRSWRLWAPAAALAGALSLAAVGAYGAQLARPERLDPRPPATGAPVPSPSGCTGLCTEPSPSPSLPAGGPRTSAPGTPIWPYTEEPGAAADAPASLHDPQQVAQQFVDDFLGLRGAQAAEATADSGAALVRLLAGEREVGVVRLVQVGADGPWSVTGATARGLSVDRPADGAGVRDPLRVTGGVAGVDVSVRVRLLTTSAAGLAPVRLAEAFAPAGAEQPWSADLAWSSDAWDVGAVVASTLDGNGALLSLAVTAVRRDDGGRPDAPPAGSTLVAVEDGHVVLLDAGSGQRLRQLSYPPAGVVDTDPARGGRDAVVFVRTRLASCETEVVRVGIARGPAGITVHRAALRRATPSVSRDGRWIAWSEAACDGSDPAVVVRGPDAQERRAAGLRPLELEVDDTGRVLVVLEDRTLVATPGASSLGPAVELRPAAGCRITSAALTDEEVLGFEECSGRVSAVRYDEEGARSAVTGVLDGLEPVRRTSVVEGLVLLWSGDAGPVQELRGKQLRTIRANEGCASDDRPAGCVAWPSW